MARLVRRKVTYGRLCQLLAYDEDAGIFTWLEHQGAVKPGDVAGTINSDGSISIGIDHRIYRAARLAHLYMTGKWPHGCIILRDGDPTNIRWENIRPVTLPQERWRRGMQRNNTSGFKGVTFDKQMKKFRVEIRANKRRYRLGHFNSVRLAHWAYRRAALRLHGEFART